MSQPHDEIHWPPRSPHEVLLSTPGGRDRLRRLAGRGSPSPSPTKRSKSNVSQSQAYKLIMEDDDDMDNDDEETLQLKLQEIQARLRLKKLQQKNKQSSDADYKNNKPDSALSRNSKPEGVSISNLKLAGLKEQRSPSLRSGAVIDVPVSPIKKRIQSLDVRRSPGRVLLGIDKGLKGNDVSLKRVPSLWKKDVTSNDRFSGILSQRSGTKDCNLDLTAGTSRPKSFNERLAAVRSQDTECQRRESRIKKSRSTAFDIDRNQMQNYKKSAVEFPDLPRQAPEFSHDEVLYSLNKSNGALLPSKTVSNESPDLGPSRIPPDSVETTVETASSGVKFNRSRIGTPNPPINSVESEGSQFESYSSQHLTKRIIPHQHLTRTLAGKKAYLIPDLLRDVKGPDFSAPDIEEDLVVLGIIASKSEPKVHQQTPKNQKRGKFMAMTLTDLKWELDFFLFDSAFEKFWKMTPGTIIAILNPLVMPPPKGKTDTGRFSLMLNSDADTILEIGTARDLGFCKSVKRDGKTCDSWIDKRHTEFCDYHVNASLKKTHASRMEVNTMTFGKGKHGGGWLNKGRNSNSTSLPGHAMLSKDQKTRYDRDSHSQIFIRQKSSANLLDDVDVDPDFFHRGSTKEERVTRRLISQERERKLEKKLAEMGSGLGSEYARARLTGSSLLEPTSASGPIETLVDATALGLLDRKVKDVALSPVKRKREIGLSVTTARGWGSNLFDDSSRSEKRQSAAPVRKKTRFVTERGIKDAGRDSLGVDTIKDITLDDSDDDLDIIPE